MPREITTHKVNGCNDQIKIEVLDEPGSGGANHLYRISGFGTATNPSDPYRAKQGHPDQYTTILFQNGPIAEVGVNGITHENLTAILIDRFEGFQRGKFACAENAVVLGHFQAAMKAMHDRTKKRLAAGVEGTHQVGPESAPKTYHPAVAAVLQFFAFSHLPAHLQEVSRPFSELATKIADGPQNAESTVALRKLLEAKDAAVRAVLFKPVS